MFTASVTSLSNNLTSCAFCFALRPRHCTQSLNVTCLPGQQHTQQHSKTYVSDTRCVCPLFVMATILSRPPSTYREAARPKLPLVVILGINGRQGTSVAKAFLGSRKYRIRGLTTRPDCFESNRWRAYGVEIREERFMEYSHVRESFKGADIIFAVSCFSTTDHRLDLAYDVGMISRSIDKLDLARKADSEKGIMVLDAAASTKGLRRFIMSTLPIVLTPGAKFATRRAQQHHESKSEQLLYLTSNVPELFHKTILVRAAACMEDFWLTLRLVCK